MLAIASVASVILAGTYAGLTMALAIVLHFAGRGANAEIGDPGECWLRQRRVNCEGTAAPRNPETTIPYIYIFWRQGSATATLFELRV